MIMTNLTPKASDSWPAWVFDDSPIEDTFGYGERAVQAIRFLKHPISGKAFQLDPWMERIVRRIYGPCHPNGHRIVRNVVMMLPRGCRKTTLGAALALLHSIGPERRPYGQVIACAYDREQARIAFEEAVGIIDMNKRLRSKVTVTDSRHRFKHKTSRSSFRAVSSDAKARNGATPAMCLFDEIHCWPSRSLYDVMRTGLGKTKNTLSVVISQAGRGQENVAFEVFDYARKVATGEVDDPGTLPILLETPKDADWQDEEVWHRVNPGLPEYPDLESLRQEAKEAKERPALRDKFKNDHLNMWMDTATSPFLDMTEWDSCRGEVDLDDLQNRPCWLGVDMSTTTDLTAIVAAWRDGEGGYIVHPHFFCPEEGITRKSERDGVPYRHWSEHGLITPTPGPVIDQEMVERYIRDFCERFKVQEIAFDKAYAFLLMKSLEKSHHPVVTLQQGWVTQSPALNRLEAAILSRKFRHDGNPILRWNFENAEVQLDSNGNRTLHKGLSTDRIDGCFATWMAVDRASFGNDQMSIYSDKSARPTGLRILGRR